MADEEPTTAEPIAYTALTKGTAVIATDGSELGTVEHVQSDESLDLFDGIVVKTANGNRFLTADQVGLITTAAVHAKVATVGELQEPHTGDAVFHDDPDEYDGNGLSKWFGKMFLREHWTRDKGPDPEQA
jgi:hypothetical protein